MLSHPLHWKKAVHNFIGLIYVPSSNLYYCTTPTKSSLSFYFSTRYKVFWMTRIIWRGPSSTATLFFDTAVPLLPWRNQQKEVFFFSENQRFSIGIAVASCFAFFVLLYATTQEASKLVFWGLLHYTAVLVGAPSILEKLALKFASLPRSQTSKPCVLCEKRDKKPTRGNERQSRSLVAFTTIKYYFGTSKVPWQ